MKKVRDTSYRLHLIAIFAIAFLCIVTYSGILNAPFVFDDTQNIEENSFIRITDFNFRQLYDTGFKSPSSLGLLQISVLP